VPSLIGQFWDAVSNDLSEVERRKLLLFWSGSSVAPTLFGGKASRSEGEEAVALDEEERFTLSRLRKRRFVRDCDFCFYFFISLLRAR